MCDKKYKLVIKVLRLLFYSRSYTSLGRHNFRDSYLLYKYINPGGEDEGGTEYSYAGVLFAPTLSKLLFRRKWSRAREAQYYLSSKPEYLRFFGFKFEGLPW